MCANVRHSGRSGTGQRALLLDYFCEFAQLFIFIRKAEININVLFVVKDDLLDELIEQAFQRIGKPAAVMTKDDKIDFIRLLNDAGAFLITKSGQRVYQVLCISKFTLYSYLNEIKAEDEETKAEQD